MPGLRQGGGRGVGGGERSGGGKDGRSGPGGAPSGTSTLKIVKYDRYRTKGPLIYFHIHEDRKYC